MICLKSQLITGRIRIPICIFLFKSLHNVSSNWFWLSVELSKWRCAFNWASQRNFNRTPHETFSNLMSIKFVFKSTFREDQTKLAISKWIWNTMAFHRGLAIAVSVLNLDIHLCEVWEMSHIYWSIWRAQRNKIIIIFICAYLYIILYYVI